MLVDLAKEQKWQELASLLEDGLNPNAIYGDGTTALHWASYHDNSDAIENLLSANANVNATTDLGVTPLWLAAENGNSDAVDILLQAQAQLLRSHHAAMPKQNKAKGRSEWSI